MNKSKKRTLRFFNTIDVLAIKEHLETMSEKGWRLTGCSGVFYTFEKSEPQKLNYHVSLYHDGSMLGSTGDNDETRAYVAEWEEQGWQFVCANGRHAYFVSDDLNADPIKVAPEEHLKKIKKCITTEIVSMPVWIIICLTNLLTFNNAWPTEFMESGNLDIFWVVICVFWIGQSLKALFFYLKNKKRVSNGEDIEFPDVKKVKCFSLIMTTLLALALVLLFAGFLFEDKKVLIFTLISLAIVSVIIFLGVKLTHSIGSKKTATQQVIIVVALAVVTCVVVIGVVTLSLFFDGGNKKIEYIDMDGNKVIESVNDDEIPLTVEDLGLDVSELIKADTSCNQYVTIYGEVTDCSQWYYDKYGGLENDIEYNIADCRFDWVKDKLIEQYMTTDYYGDDAKFIEVSGSETKAWEAEKVYTMTDGYDDNARLVVYEDIVLFIETDIEFNDKVIKNIRTKLADKLK